MQSLSAKDYIAKIPVDSAKVVAITGDKDDNTLPRFGRECIEKMKASGIDARFKLVEHRGHNSVLASESIVNAVRELSAP